MKQQDKAFMIMGATVVTLVATVAGVYLFGAGNDDSALPATTTTTATTATPSTATQTTSTPSTTSTTTSNASTTSSSTMYKDGTYSATSSYYVPRGSNSITAKVTIASGKVTDVSVTNNYADRESGMYIDSFMSSIKSAIVGQSVDGISLSRIGGATLTTDGFSSALTSIISQAKA